jgi:hypothetical protein
MLNPENNPVIPRRELAFAAGQEAPSAVREGVEPSISKMPLLEVTPLV